MSDPEQNGESAPASSEADTAVEIEAIVRQYEGPLLRYSIRLVNDSSTAQDVVQNAFIKLHRQWKPGFRPSDNLKAWLYRVTHNEAVDHIRKESRLQVLHKKHAERKESECPDGLDCETTDRERRARVLACMRKLHPREQQVLALRLDEGLSYREISRVTGRSEGNVGNILHHAVRKLSADLRKEQTGACLRSEVRS